MEFLKFVTLKKVHKDSKGPEKRGTGSPIETINMVQHPNHRSQRNGVLGAR